jgi:hypothetical protein
MSSILGCDGRLLLLSAFARNVHHTKNVDLSAIELATKRVPSHISRMSLVQSGGILFTLNLCKVIHDEILILSPGNVSPRLEIDVFPGISGSSQLVVISGIGCSTNR